MKKKKIIVKDLEISLIQSNGMDYISLTDMIKAKDGDFFVSDWLRNRNTLEFLGIWETVNNPNFNCGEFAIIKSQSGLNSFKISAKELIIKTSIIGISSKAGRYGGTYAHKDIAFEFGMWISPEFKIYLIKEFQRLKEAESERSSLSWDIRRELAKVNYKIHTDAIKENLIPLRIASGPEKFAYASEGDLLNKAMFGVTAKEWRDRHPDKDGNIRDYATIEQLVVLCNLESLNAVMIKQAIVPAQRLLSLNQIAIDQMRAILGHPALKRLK